MNDEELSVSDQGETKKEYDLIFGKHMENYNFEATALHRKLQSKAEALRILRKELERFRIERDQFKLMAETLQLRYSAIKRYSDFGTGETRVADLLHETRERNIKLTTEVEALKQKVYELQGDIQVLRSKSVKDESHRRSCGDFTETAQSKEELLWKEEKANFISHLENLKKKNAQLAFDLKALIDEKEELITERDAYKCKAHRLNHELINALRAKEAHPKFLDVDGIILENKYLHERVKNLEFDLEMSNESANKYKSMLDAKRKKGIIKLGSSSNEESILSHKQAKAMLENGVELPTKTETIQDLRSLCLALLDNLNDKNVALNHQKKTNRMLASKIAELEQRLQIITGQESSSDGFSPSLYLLNGYSAAEVDSSDSKGEDDRVPEIPQIVCSTHSAEEVNPSEPESNITSDDGMSSFTSESAHSAASSVYDIDLGLDDLTKTAIYHSTEHPSSSRSFTKTKTSSTTDSGHYTLFNSARTNSSSSSNYNNFISNSIAQERVNDLKDLPFELAEMVQKALLELDMRDFEDEVIMSDKTKAGASLLDSSIYMETLQEEACTSDSQ